MGFDRRPLHDSRASRRALGSPSPRRGEGAVMSTAIDLCSWRAVSTTPRRTPHDSHHRPRDAPRPSFARFSHPSEIRGRREGQVPTDTCGPPAEKNAGGRNHGLSRCDPAFPARWFSRLWRALLGAPAFWPPSPARIIAADLASASGCRDHALSRPHRNRSSARSLALRSDTAIASPAHVS